MPLTNSKKILFVSAEIMPYMPETDMAFVARYLPQYMQEKGMEIRSFMPRFGSINERRHQLHEVIRLSGMNIIIKDIDRPLIIKVASIPSARMQIYFIDNDEYFHRKQIYGTDTTGFFADNDERGIFFARGVLETVKKLRWKPDLVVCMGWPTALLPLYLKKVYRDDPLFTDTRVVLSVYDDLTTQTFGPEMAQKIMLPGIQEEDVALLHDRPDALALAKTGLLFSDGLVIGKPGIDPQVEAFARERGLPVLPYVEPRTEESNYAAAYYEFFEQFLA